MSRAASSPPPVHHCRPSLADRVYSAVVGAGILASAVSAYELVAHDAPLSTSTMSVLSVPGGPGGCPAPGGVTSGGAPSGG
ncbi:hypothetical protein ACFVQ3_02585 [Oerskovia sp. NPDC057915]|uniref:hypothetical protein n=1 Tax=Oerskovia sp. NPDC057915 TaxID=3346280 RepID=UPI0036D78ACE